MAAGNIIVSAVVSSIPVVTAVVTSISVSSSYSQPIVTPDDTGSRIQVEAGIIPTRPLAAENVNLFESNIKNINKSPSDDVTLSEGIDQFDIELVKTDSVTAVESRVKVFTDFIDFDPSDDDVDATPVTISESAAIDVTIGELADNDDVTPSESIAKEPTKPGITASVSTSEAIDQLRPHKNVTDTATTSEAIDRFDVTTVLDDTVTITESTAKEITPAGKTDSVSAVQSNVKTFTSNIDFDLSDADVDPDPVTASDVINEFDFDKGLTDTSSVTESTAKNFTHGGLSDTASPTESTEFDITVPGFADSFTAVEGIKLNPSIPLSDTASPTEAAVFSPSLVFAHAATVAESINVILTLGQTDRLYPQRIYVSAGDESPYLVGFHRGSRAGVVSRLTDSFVLNDNRLNIKVISGDVFTEDKEEARGFVQDIARHRITDFSGQLNGSDMLINSTVIHEPTTDGAGHTPFVGILNGAEQLNMVLLNNDSVTYGEETNAGLIVNFMYTDTEDSEIGGHFLNETPLCAGAYA